MKLNVILLALLVGGLPLGAFANGPFYVTFGGSLRYAQINDRTLYLGPSGVTNPAYLVGVSVYDYNANALQPDGTFAYPQYQRVDEEVDGNILVAVAYDPAGPISQSWDPFNIGVRRYAFPPLGSAFISLSINIRGQNFSIHLPTRGVASSFTSAQNPAQNKTELELKYFVGDENPDPNIAEYNPDPSYDFPVPTLERHINALNSSWHRNPGTFEIIDGANEDHQFTLIHAVIRVYFNGVAIADLAGLDLSDPATAALVSSVYMQLYFEDVQTLGINNGRYTIVYDSALTSTLNQDLDEDGLADSADNCAAAPNFDQINTDGANDGGDACDTDNDNDGRYDVEDNCPLLPNLDQADEDNNGIGNTCDPDYVPPCSGCDCAV